MIPIIIKKSVTSVTVVVCLLRRFLYGVRATNRAMQKGIITNFVMVSAMVNGLNVSEVWAKIITKSGTSMGLSKLESVVTTSDRLGSPPNNLLKKTPEIPAGTTDAKTSPKNISSVKTPRRGKSNKGDAR